MTEDVSNSFVQSLRRVLNSLHYYGKRAIFGFIFIVVELNYCEKKGEGKEKREKEEKRKGRRERRKKRKKGEDGNLTTTKNYYYLDKPIGASPRVWFHSSSSSALI